MDYNAAALEMHAKYPGKLIVNSLFEVKDRDALSTAYTPRRCGALPPDQGEPGRCV